MLYKGGASRRLAETRAMQPEPQQKAWESLGRGRRAIPHPIRIAPARLGPPEPFSFIPSFVPSRMQRRLRATRMALPALANPGTLQMRFTRNAIRRLVMATIASPTLGRPVWYQLMTTDMAAATGRSLRAAREESVKVIRRSAPVADSRQRASA